MDRKTFVLIDARVRRNAFAELHRAPDGYVVRISEPTRSGPQNDHFHALCNDLAKSPLEWAGKRRKADEWKALLVSGHAVATNRPGEVVPGLEGEFVAIRESTARMGVSRASSLIEYTLAFCVTNNVDLVETRKGGFLSDPKVGEAA